MCNKIRDIYAFFYLFIIQCISYKYMLHIFIFGFSHVARSQSFHGSVGLAISDWSDEEPVISADEASLY